MSSIARHRCFHHPAREAAARCPECGRFHCRECVTEHDGRVVCASCLARRKAEVRRGAAARMALPARVAQVLFGLLLTWIFFVAIGRSLSWLPDEFHRRRYLFTFSDPSESDF